MDESEIVLREYIAVLEEGKVVMSNGGPDAWWHLFPEHALLLPLLQELAQLTQA